MVPADAGDHAVLSPSRDRDQAEERAQGLGVGECPVGAVPLVDPAVDAGRLVAEPELGAEPGKAGEQGRVRDRLGPEEPVRQGTAAEQAEAESDDEERRLPRSLSQHRLPEDGRGRPVLEPEALSEAPMAWQPRP